MTLPENVTLEVRPRRGNIRTFCNLLQGDARLRKIAALPLAMTLFFLVVKKVPFASRPFTAAELSGLESHDALADT